MHRQTYASVKEPFKKDREKMPKEPTPKKKQPTQKSVRRTKRKKKSHLRFQKFVVVKRANVSSPKMSSKKRVCQQPFDLKLRVIETMYELLHKVSLKQSLRKACRVHSWLLLRWWQTVLEEVPSFTSCLCSQQTLQLQKQVPM